ncbi:hypothetical protein BGX26_004647, partial [Mortierella sp. AD094]
MTTNSSPAPEPPGDDYLTTWKQHLSVSALVHLKLPTSFEEDPEPNKFPCQPYVLPPLSTQNMFSNNRLCPLGATAKTFTPASLKFLDGVYDILDEHQEQFEQFVNWVPTILHKHHSVLAAQLQHELDHNTGACLTTILSSTQMSIPTTSCLASERWLDIDCLNPCLDAFDCRYSTNSNIFLLSLELSTYVTSNDDHSEWRWHCNRNFEVKSLTDILGIFPMRAEDCRDSEGCGCRRRGGCKKNKRHCKCDDHCVCNAPRGCEHPDPCGCQPDHWAFFRFDLQRSVFLFGDSLNNDLPKPRIARLKKFIAMVLDTPDKNDTDNDHPNKDHTDKPRINLNKRWPTQTHDIPKQPDDSGSCGVIVLNAIQHALDPSTPIWTHETNQGQRAHLLELASRHKSLVKWPLPIGPSPSRSSSPSDPAAPFTSSTPDAFTSSSTSPNEPSMPVDPNSTAVDNGAQPGTASSASIPTSSTDLTTLPIHHDFTKMEFKTLDDALQTIYAFANTHHFPIFRDRTKVDPAKYKKRRRVEILCCCSGTRDDVTKKNDKRRSNKQTIKSSPKELKWDKTDCPWRIFLIPDKTTPKWRVSTFGTDGTCRHNHAVGTPSM